MAREQVYFDIDKAIEIFKRTQSWRAVGRELGVHPQSVKARLAPMGYETKQKVGYAKKWDVELAKDLRKQGLSFFEIGRKLGASASTIQRGLKGEK